MLKKILKWTGIVLGSIIALLVIFYAVVYFSTQSRIYKTYDVKAQQLTIPTDSASYARGRHIAEIRGCMGCHGKNLGGYEAFLPEGSAPGTLYAPNITSGKGGIQYNDEDFAAQRELKKFLLKNLYKHFSVMQLRFKAENVIRSLFSAFMSDARLLPDQFQAHIDKDGLPRVVADYISGMTDRYAFRQYNRLFTVETV